MSETEKEKAKKAQTQMLRNAFEGMKGRQPKSDQELKEWLASPEGKQATMFEPTSLSVWGETGRS
jgi:predicted aminopeptidase